MSEMVTIPREVIERLLDALCGAKGYSASMMSFHVNKVDAGIRDCRTALAAGEARPEPFAFVHKRGQDDEEFIHAVAVNGPCPDCEPLYLHPPPPAETTPAPVYGVMDPDYARIVSITRCIARAEGYAMAMHGSFTRDLDLIAVPWTDAACEPDHLVRRIEAATGTKWNKHPPADKPHGRRAWTLLMPTPDDPRFIDLSVMPRAAPAADAAVRGAVFERCEISEVKLPPLPQGIDLGAPHTIYEKMREYGAACARAALEAAAQKCEQTPVLRSPGVHGWTALTVQGWMIDAIRALSVGSGGSGA